MIQSQCSSFTTQEPRNSSSSKLSSSYESTTKKCTKTSEPITCCWCRSLLTFCTARAASTGILPMIMARYIFQPWLSQEHFWWWCPGTIISKPWKQKSKYKHKRSAWRTQNVCFLNAWTHSSKPHWKRSSKQPWIWVISVLEGALTNASYWLSTLQWSMTGTIVCSTLWPTSNGARTASVMTHGAAVERSACKPTCLDWPSSWTRSTAKLMM